MELISYDESLYHQVPKPFGESGFTDHRFYDRYSYTLYSPDGNVGLLSGLAVYKNLNVMDGFAATQVDSKWQRNMRFSRPLHPIVEPLQLGPMRTEFPPEPFKVTRMICEPNEYGDAFDLTFRPVFTRSENPHYGEANGRVHQDYRRFSQVGWTSGSIVVDGNEHQFDRWFGWRDHSWGVRPPGVGGFEPFTGQKARGGIPSSSRAGGLGILLVYCASPPIPTPASSSPSRTRTARPSTSTAPSRMPTGGWSRRWSPWSTSSPSCPTRTCSRR